MDQKPWKYPLAVSPSDLSSIMAVAKSFANHCDSFASFDPDDYLDIHVPKTFATTVSTSAPAPDATSLLDVSRYSGNLSHSNTLDGSSSAPANPTSALTTSITSNLHPPTTLDSPEGEGEALPRGQPRRRRQGSSERDYSEEIRNLNKKRKRTGQACDRCRVCLSISSHSCPVFVTGAPSCLLIPLSAKY